MKRSPDLRRLVTAIVLDILAERDAPALRPAYFDRDMPRPRYSDARTRVVTR